jgi:hypothetical protein
MGREYREMRNTYRILVGKPEGTRLLRRRRCGWEDNIKIDSKETGWDGVDWIHLAQDRDQWWGSCGDMVTDLQFP